MFFPFFIGFKDEVKQQQKKNQWLKRAECQTGKVGRAALSPPQTLCFTFFSHSRARFQAKKMLDFIDNQHGHVIMSQGVT